MLLFTLLFQFFRRDYIFEWTEPFNNGLNLVLFSKNSLIWADFLEKRF